MFILDYLLSGQVKIKTKIMFEDKELKKMKLLLDFI